MIFSVLLQAYHESDICITIGILFKYRMISCDLYKICGEPVGSFDIVEAPQNWNTDTRHEPGKLEKARLAFGANTKERREKAAPWTYRALCGLDETFAFSSLQAVLGAGVLVKETPRQKS